jgi:hypothetical protein
VTIAAWQLVDAHEGFEVLFLRPTAGGGHLLEGYSAGVEDGQAWGLRYAIAADEVWTTRAASIAGHAGRVRLVHDGQGGWRVNDTPVPELDGCLDVDLEVSACTNTLPVRRLGLDPGDAAADAPAAYVRAFDLRVERLEQSYRRLPDEGDQARYAYASPAFSYEAVLVYDRSGLIVDYPGIAVRVGV